MKYTQSNSLKSEKSSQEFTYQIEGEFLGFISKSGGELKYIQVLVGEKILPIKLAKEIRENLAQKIVKGDRVSLLLEKTVSKQGFKIKLKTGQVTILNKDNETINANSTNNLSTSKVDKNSKNTILLCGKSSCSKKKGKQVYSALKETLKQLELENEVTIKITGCQKQCKKAPSIILMPGKVKHNYVDPDDLPSLLASHYLDNRVKN